MPLSEAERTERQAWFEREFTQDSFFLLKTLHHFNLDSRRLIAENIARRVYDTVEAREEPFAAFDDRTRRYLLDLVNIEVLSTTFMAIEDLGKLLVCSRRSPKDWASILVHTKEGASLRAVEKASDWSDEQLRAAFYFHDAAFYGETDSGNALATYQARFTTDCHRVLQFMAAFLGTHRLAYDRYKHGNPMLFGMVGEPPAPGFDGPITVFAEPPSKKRGEIVLVGRRPLTQQLHLLGRAVALSRMLCERWMHLAEFGELLPPLACYIRESGGGYALHAYFPKDMPEGEREAARTFARLVTPRLERVEIEIGFQTSVDNNLLRMLAGFYQKEWP